MIDSIDTKWERFKFIMVHATNATVDEMWDKFKTVMLDGALNTQKN